LPLCSSQYAIIIWILPISHYIQENGVNTSQSQQNQGKKVWERLMTNGNGGVWDWIWRITTALILPPILWGVLELINLKEKVAVLSSNNTALEEVRALRVEHGELLQLVHRHMIDYSEFKGEFNAVKRHGTN